MPGNNPTLFRAGELRHRIRIERPVDTQGEDYGEARIDSWETVWSCWAGCTTLGGSELLGNDKLESEQSVLWTIRYHAGITERMRVVHKGETFNVEAVNDVNRLKRKLELTCTVQKA